MDVKENLIDKVDEVIHDEAIIYIDSRGERFWSNPTTPPPIQQHPLNIYRPDICTKVH